MALGKGLGALIPQKSVVPIVKNTVSDQVEGKAILEVELDKIQVNPHQPRQIFNPEELENLINSIKEHGIIQPLLVTKIDDGYQLIAGERRFRSAKYLNLEKVPVIVREADEQTKLELALIENIQRKNLNPLEEAISFQQLIDEFSLTQQQVAQKIGKSRSSVANSLRLLKLPQEIQKAILDEKISEGHAKSLASLDSYTQQVELYKKIINNKMSVRDVETQVRRAHGKKNIADLDPQDEENQNRLKEILGAKVEIKKIGNHGRLVISFKNQSDLESLLKKLLLLK